MRALALLVVLHHELSDGVCRLLGLLVPALGMEVEHLFERVEPLAAIGALRVKQQHVVAAAGELVAR